MTHLRKIDAYLTHVMNRYIIHHKPDTILSENESQEEFTFEVRQHLSHFFFSMHVALSII